VNLSPMMLYDMNLSLVMNRGVHYSGDILQGTTLGQQMFKDVLGTSEESSFPSMEGWLG